MTTVNIAARWASYAVALGYTLKFREGAPPEAPPEEFHLRDVFVAQTARGWRVFQRNPAALTDPAQSPYLPGRDDDFFSRLHTALLEGTKRARPATEADLNPLLPPLRALLRLVTTGNAQGKNPYAHTEVKQALRAIVDVTGYPGNHLNANDKVEGA